MRQEYMGTIVFFQRKRYNTQINLPYSFISLTDVTTVSGESVARYVQIRYTQTLHSLGIKKGDRIAFTAQLDSDAFERGLSGIFVRPAKYRVVELESATLQTP